MAVYQSYIHAGVCVGQLTLKRKPLIQWRYYTNSAAWPQGALTPNVYRCCVVPRGRHFEKLMPFY